MRRHYRRNPSDNSIVILAAVGFGIYAWSKGWLSGLLPSASDAGAGAGTSPLGTPNDPMGNALGNQPIGQNNNGPAPTGSGFAFPTGSPSVVQGGAGAGGGAPNMPPLGRYGSRRRTLRR